MTAVIEQAPAKPIERQAYESFASQRPAAQGVDRENKVIRGVKILGVWSITPARVVGIDSDDPYRYSLDAMEAAAPSYENVDVNIDHPELIMQRDGTRAPKSEARGLDPKFGWLTNIVVVRASTDEESGMYGDLHYLESHPMTPRILEFIERNPTKVSLSHVAGVAGHVRPDGIPEVTKIGEPQSVDLIGERPGTTNGIFESAVSAGELKMLPEDEKQAATATEMGDEETLNPEEETVATEMDEVPVDAAPAEKSADEMIQAGLTEKAVACLGDSAKTAEEKKAAIGAIIDQMETLKEGDVEAVESDGSEGDEDKTVAAEAEGDDEDKDKTVAAESAAIRKVQAEIKALKKRDAARDLAATAIESAGCQMTRERVNDLAEIDNPKLRTAVIEGWMAKDGMSIAAESGAETLPISKPRSGLKPAVESARTGGKPGQSKADEKPDVLSLFGVPSSVN